MLVAEEGQGHLLAAGGGREGVVGGGGAVLGQLGVVDDGQDVAAGGLDLGGAEAAAGQTAVAGGQGGDVALVEDGGTLRINREALAAMDALAGADGGQRAGDVGDLDLYFFL